MKKVVWLLVAVMFAAIGSVSADEGKAGYAGAFFYVPIGARPTAMGHYPPGGRPAWLDSGGMNNPG